MKKTTNLLLLSLLIWGMNSLSMDQQGSSPTMNQGSTAPLCSQDQRQEKLATVLKSLRPVVDCSNVLGSKERKSLARELQALQRQNNQSPAAFLKKLDKNGTQQLVYFGKLRLLSHALYIQHLYFQFLQVYQFTELGVWSLSKNLSDIGQVKKYKNGYCSIELEGSSNPLTNYFQLKYGQDLKQVELTDHQMKVLNLCLCSERPELQRLGQARLFFLNRTIVAEKDQNLKEKLALFYVQNLMQFVKKLDLPEIQSQVLCLMDMYHAHSTWVSCLFQQHADGSLNNTEFTLQDKELHKSIRILSKKYKTIEPWIQKLYIVLVQEMKRVLDNLNNLPQDVKSRIEHDSLDVQKSNEINVNLLCTDEIKDVVTKPSFNTFLEFGCYGHLLPKDVNNCIRLMIKHSVDLNQMPSSLPPFKLADVSWLSLPNVEQQLSRLGIDQRELQLQEEMVQFFEAFNSQPSTITTTPASAATAAAALAPTRPSVRAIDAQESTAVSNTSSGDIVRFTNNLTNCQEIIFKLKPENPITNSCTLNYTHAIKKWLNNPDHMVQDLGYVDPSNPRSKYFRECPWAPAAFHAFSGAIDAYVNQYGDCTIEKSKNRMHLKVPGMLVYPLGKKRNGKSQESGVFHYIIDMTNNQCFHRMFMPVDANHFVNRVWENNELFDAEFPSLHPKK